MTNASEQWQVRDVGVYASESVITTVDGYLWNEVMEELPRIAAYRLACGVSVPGSQLRWATAEERIRAGYR